VGMWLGSAWSGEEEARREGWLLTLALARTDGGMTFSGPNACRGSMKEVRILAHFLHSAAHQGQKRESPTWVAWTSQRGTAGTDLHAIDDGRGLLIPMAAGWAGALSEP
jgi:hypothetical protein